ncbi:RNA polymerase subunit sigma [Vibrio nigripulchritudo]|nr:RNA polymerase subunit sigma [Vibrio nigripulchritudo]BDU32906.1 RNA polymerase subunit sigma [Vibrio nigripulchritudo]BDU38950.1 RNA polymerase subunit sigma [Vibrio nigripulchritudo]BDU44670.1 RNA polymerase subunit sigma [Vibrio nigripulchritudo]
MCFKDDTHMPVTLFALLLVLAIAAGWYFVRFQKQHTLGEDAPEQKAEVTVLDKQIIDVPDAQPGEEPQEYWIYVQKGKVGPKREFQIGVHYYQALNPGDKGTLTYQGQKFLHFAMKR